VVLRLGHLEFLASFDQHKQTVRRADQREGRVGFAGKKNTTYTKKIEQGGGELPKRALAKVRKGDEWSGGGG
jgi:hypothetical protein